MVTPEARKAHIDALIDMDPIEITIKRTERVQKDGGYNTTEVTLPPQQGRLFLGRKPQLVKDESGEEHFTEMILLSPADGDVRADNGARDEFDHPVTGERMHVREVFPAMVKGVLCGFQSTCRKVK